MSRGARENDRLEHVIEIMGPQDWLDIIAQTDAHTFGESGARKEHLWRHRIVDHFEPRADAEDTPHDSLTMPAKKNNKKKTTANVSAPPSARPAAETSGPAPRPARGDAERFAENIPPLRRRCFYPTCAASRSAPPPPARAV